MSIATLNNRSSTESRIAVAPRNGNRQCNHRGIGANGALRPSWGHVTRMAVFARERSNRATQSGVLFA